MSGFELFEIWIEAFFTLALLSFLYKDNPVYKLAEHIFAGLTAGYQVGLIWDTVVIQKLWDPMLAGRWWLFVPGILGLFMFARLSSKYSWLARMPLALVMAVTAGVFLTTQLHGFVLPAMQSTMTPQLTTQAEVLDDAASNPGRLIIGSALEYDASVIGIPEPVADSGSLSIVPGSIKISPATIESPTQLVTVEVPFTDQSSLSFGGQYWVRLAAYRQGGKSAVAIPINSGHEREGRGGMTIEKLDNSGHYLARYQFEAGMLGDGVYAFSAAVERRAVRFFLTTIIVIGVLSTLIYFYFSKPHTGALGVAAKVGIWFIMISFGAHFGYTVMGRVSLLIGRTQFLIDDWIGSVSRLF